MSPIIVVGSVILVVGLLLVILMVGWPEKFKLLKIPGFFTFETHAPTQPESPIPANSVVHNVTSNNQQGGQTAHTIINHETPDRHLLEIAAHLVRELSQLPPQKFNIRCNPGAEPNNLMKELGDALNNAGWTGKADIIDLTGGIPAGIHIVVKEPNPSVIALAQILIDGGLKVGTGKQDWATQVEIRIGAKS